MDFPAPVAQNIVAPNPATVMNSYSGMLGIKQQQQALQTGAYQQQSAQAGAQQDQQRSQELQAAQQLVLNGAKSGKYTTADGKLDRQKMADDITSVAPTYGHEAATPLLSQANEIVANTQAHQNLTRSQQQQMGSSFGALATKGDLSNTDFVDTLNTLTDENKDPAFKRMAMSMLTHLPPNASAAQLQGIARRWAIAATGPESAEGQSAPNVQGVQGVGQPGQPGAGQPGLVPTNMNPQAPGGVGQVGPVQQQSVAPGAAPVNNAFGQTGVFNPQTNTVTPLGTGRGGQGASSFVQPVAGQPQILENVENARAVGDQAPTIRNVNSQLLKLSSDTSTGPGTQTLQKIAAAVGLPSGSNYQEIGAYLDRQSALQARSMGVPNTNAGLAAAERSTGTTEYTPQALQEKVKFADALNSSVMAYRKGLDKTVGTGGTPDLSKFQAFRSAWAQNYDPDVFRVEDAQRRGDTAELTSLKKRIGPAGMKDLATKSAALRQLENGQVPP